MRRRTLLAVATILVAAVAILAGLWYVWMSINRPGGGSQGNPAVLLVPVQIGLAWPVALAFAPDGRGFFAERYTGNIRIIENGVVLPTPFYTLTDTATGGERGLLGLALDPAFSTTPRLYAHQTYSDTANGTIYNRVVRIQASGDTGLSHVVILDMPPLSAATNHNGGVIAFGPDGKLYVVVGENANPSLAQNPMSLLGKVLRLNTDGSAPSDNPFYGSLSWDNRIYTYGHRNMFGLAFHPATGRAYVTENGPACNDEINALTPGSNYGWGPTATCASPPPPPTNTNRDGAIPVLPIDWWTPTTAPTNGDFFTGSLLPESRNDLIFGAWNDHRLRDLKLDPSDGTTVVNDTVLATATEGILDVQMGRDGFLWVTTPSAIYRLEAAPTVMMSFGLVGFAGLPLFAVPARAETSTGPRPRRASSTESVRRPSRKP